MSTVDKAQMSNEEDERKKKTTKKKKKKKKRWVRERRTEKRRRRRRRRCGNAREVLTLLYVPSENTEGTVQDGFLVQAGEVVLDTIVLFSTLTIIEAI